MATYAAATIGNSSANSFSSSVGSIIDVNHPYYIQSSDNPDQDGGKRTGLNFDRVKYWLWVGARPSDPVQRLLFRAGVLPLPPMLAMGRKGGPRDTRPTDPMTGRYVTSEKPTSSDQSEDGGEDPAAS